MVCYIALLYLLTIKLSNISITKRLSSRDASNVYKGKIALYANSNAIALKVVGISIYASYLYVCLYLLVS
jgi:hypothetical protein